MKKKPSILLTNDDGVNAPGIQSLWRSVKEHSHTFIVAPDSEKSGMGVATSPNTSLHIKNVSWGSHPYVWSVNGTPADCIKLGMNVILKDKQPDLIISGINKGSNAGRCIFYSGTVGGVIEGVLQGVLGIAFSSESHKQPLFEPFEPFIFPIISFILQHPPSAGTFFNVTFPNRTDIKGLRLARQGQGFWHGNPTPLQHTDGRLSYALTDGWHFPIEDEESDIALLKKGYITIVPIHIREWTDFSYFEQKKELFDSSLTLE